jgi:hypothetical protein
MGEEQIIQKLQSRDKDEILDIPTLLLNERNIDLNALIAKAAKAKVESEILALIEKVYRDYHLLPYHGERLKIYFGDIIEI